MTVSERLRSYWGPLWLAHHFNLRSSQSRKPQKLHRPPFEWTTKSLHWYPFWCVVWKATLVTAAKFYGAVIPSNLYFLVNSAVVRSFIKHTPWAVCFPTVMKKLACFYEPQFCWISLNISISDSVLETKELQANVLNSTRLWTLMVCEL